jgi:hypothetical protein
MSVTLSIVIPTCGRRSVVETVGALVPQLSHGDELVIVRDSSGDYGHTARNRAMPRCAGSHLMFIDDDDRHLGGALELVRRELELDPDRVHLFAMRYHDGRELAPGPLPLQVGYVSTQMLVVPNQAGRLGTWGNRYEGDYDFASSTLELRGDEPVLHPVAIALVGRPAHERGER